jgi:hypothetical protein
MERLSISSFLKCGHEFHLYAYNDVPNAPPGTILKDAGEILPAKDVFVDKELKSSYANFSDVFRYKLLLEKGGFWSDVDIVCLKPFDFSADFVFASEKTEKGSEEKSRYGIAQVNGCVLKAPAGSEIMEHCYNSSVNLSAGNHKWWELGPTILSEATRKFHLENYVLPYRTFIPVHWWDWKDLISDSLSTRIKLKFQFRSGVHAVHLWNSMWRRADADKNHSYAHDCFYERMKQLYLDS